MKASTFSDAHKAFILKQGANAGSGNAGAVHDLFGGAPGELGDQGRYQPLLHFFNERGLLAQDLAAHGAVDGDQGDRPELQDHPGDGITRLVQRDAPTEVFRRQGASSSAISEIRQRSDVVISRPAPSSAGFPVESPIGHAAGRPPNTQRSRREQLRQPGLRQVHPA